MVGEGGKYTTTHTARASEDEKRKFISLTITPKISAIYSKHCLNALGRTIPAEQGPVRPSDRHRQTDIIIVIAITVSKETNLELLAFKLFRARRSSSNSIIISIQIKRKCSNIVMSIDPALCHHHHHSRNHQHY